MKQGWHPTRRRREAQRRRRQRIAKVAVAVVLTGVATLALVRALAPTPSELPELLTPADLQSIAAVSRTDRMGTLFKATLVTAPAPERHGEFTASMWALASRAGSAGYETVLVTGPDGSTLVSGPVTDPWIAPPGHRGT